MVEQKQQPVAEAPLYPQDEGIESVVNTDDLIFWMGLQVVGELNFKKLIKQYAAQQNNILQENAALKGVKIDFDLKLKSLLQQRSEQDMAIAQVNKDMNTLKGRLGSVDQETGKKAETISELTTKLKDLEQTIIVKTTRISDVEKSNKLYQDNLAKQNEDLIKARSIIAAREAELKLKDTELVQAMKKIQAQEQTMSAMSDVQAKLLAK